MSNLISSVENQSSCTEHPCNSVAVTIETREKDLGGFSVRRVLPYPTHRMVGPFIFFDHLGPVEFAPGQGIDVRPHPHIGLATITYLFEGEIFHRDSLGEKQAIQPGAINLMIAGKGVVHSERTADEVREAGHRLHALQLWVALPEEEEECEPSFTHYEADSLPTLNIEGAAIRVMIGEAYGVSSPVATLSKTLYVEVQLDEGAVITLPDGIEERAIYVVSGALKAKDTSIPEYQMVVFEPTEGIELKAVQDSRFVIIGGAPIGERHIYWNFVSSNKARIEQAKEDWREMRFDTVPGETEFIPLPD